MSNVATDVLAADPVASGFSGITATDGGVVGRNPPKSGRRSGGRIGLAGEIVREAFFGLYHHRFRAALSMLGISWGIISVVVLLAYGEGFRRAIEAGMRGAYADGTVIVFPGQTSLQAGGERAGKRIRVTV